VTDVKAIATTAQHCFTQTRDASHHTAAVASAAASAAASVTATAAAA